MNRLAGKVALITGGGSGIGAATARLMCSEGAKVMLVDANPEGLANTQKDIAERVPGASIRTFQADVSDATKAMGSVDETLREFTRLDILVNNASMRNYSAISDAKPEEWQAMASVNLIGTANYCRAALPTLRKTEGACIVNVSSAYAVAGRKGMGLYDATKAGMLAMTRTLACEEAVYGVRVNAICPGSTLPISISSVPKPPAKASSSSRPSDRPHRFSRAGRHPRKLAGRSYGSPATRLHSSPAPR